LDLFSVLASGPAESHRIAQSLSADVRGTTTLLDALVALGLLDKLRGKYSLAPKVEKLLLPNRPGSVLAMVRHHANCMRRWIRLAYVVRTGRPVEREPSIRGESADQESFIEAMHDVSSTTAPGLVKEIGAMDFEHMLDVGGGPGTWTIALLRAHPAATATLFDLPHVIPIARQHIEAEGLADRVRLVAGDFVVDPLPAGADLAWLGAIVHQNSREQNRRLFGSAFRALKRRPHERIAHVAAGGGPVCGQHAGGDRWGRNLHLRRVAGGPAGRRLLGRRRPATRRRDELDHPGGETRRHRMTIVRGHRLRRIVTFARPILLS
jgi:hypothetical protein